MILAYLGYLCQFRLIWVYCGWSWLILVDLEWSWFIPINQNFQNMDHSRILILWRNLTLLSIPEMSFSGLLTIFSHYGPFQNFHIITSSKIFTLWNFQELSHYEPFKYFQYFYHSRISSILPFKKSHRVQKTVAWPLYQIA